MSVALCLFPIPKTNMYTHSFFTLPEDLSTTLLGTNGTEFKKFLDTSSKLGSLSDSEHITLFALTDSGIASVGALLTKDTVQQNIVKGAAWYTPDSIGGKSYNTAAGGKLDITQSGKDYYVNGIKIVSSDNIMKNGVVHYVESVGFFFIPPCRNRFRCRRAGSGWISKLTNLADHPPRSIN